LQAYFQSSPCMNGRRGTEVKLAQAMHNLLGSRDTLVLQYSDDNAAILSLAFYHVTGKGALPLVAKAASENSHHHSPIQMSFDHPSET